MFPLRTRASGAPAALVRMGTSWEREGIGSRDPNCGRSHRTPEAGNPYAVGMPITPDTTDWTWVLERPCTECGFDSAAVRYDEIPDLVRRNAVA